jgi:predicted MPP superfamily phosphohydrolase
MKKQNHVLVNSVVLFFASFCFFTKCVPSIPPLGQSKIQKKETPYAVQHTVARQIWAKRDQWPKPEEVAEIIQEEFDKKAYEAASRTLQKELESAGEPKDPVMWLKEICTQAAVAPKLESVEVIIGAKKGEPVKEWQVKQTDLSVDLKMQSWSTNSQKKLLPDKKDLQAVLIKFLRLTIRQLDTAAKKQKALPDAQEKAQAQILESTIQNFIINRQSSYKIAKNAAEIVENPIMDNAAKLAAVATAEHLASIPYAQKLLLHPDDEIYFVGDIHGCIGSLVRNMWIWRCIGLLDENFKITDNKYIVFLGDYVDYGQNNIFVLYTLLQLKLHNWDHVFLCKGNHENASLHLQEPIHMEGSREFLGLLSDTIKSYGEELGYDLWAMCEMNFCNILPMALYIGIDTTQPFIQCCHGGIEPAYNPKAFLAGAASYQSLRNIFKQSIFGGNAYFLNNLVALDDNQPLQGNTPRTPDPNGPELPKKEQAILRWLSSNLNNFPPTYADLMTAAYHLKGDTYSGLLWSDFSADKKFGFNTQRNGGFFAGQETINKYYASSNICAILRGHQHNYGIKIGALTAQGENERWSAVLKWGMADAPQQSEVKVEMPPKLSGAQEEFKRLPFIVKLTQFEAQNALEQARWKNFRQQLPSFLLSELKTAVSVLTFTTASEAFPRTTTISGVDSPYDAFGILTIAPNIQDSRMAIYEAEIRINLTAAIEQLPDITAAQTKMPGIINEIVLRSEDQQQKFLTLLENKLKSLNQGQYTINVGGKELRDIRLDIKFQLLSAKIVLFEKQLSNPKSKIMTDAQELNRVCDNIKNELFSIPSTNPYYIDLKRKLGTNLQHLLEKMLEPKKSESAGKAKKPPIPPKPAALPPAEPKIPAASMAGGPAALKEKEWAKFGDPEDPVVWLREIFMHAAIAPNADHTDLSKEWVLEGDASSKEKWFLKPERYLLPDDNDLQATLITFVRNTKQQLEKECAHQKSSPEEADRKRAEELESTIQNFVTNWPASCRGAFPSKLASIPHVQKLIVEKDNEIYLVGDIHGSIGALVRNMWIWRCIGLLDENFKIAQGKYIVFLGDYVDRGQHGIFVLYTLLKLKLLNWERVVLCRGNHENSSTAATYGFLDELNAYGSKKSDLFASCVVNCFNILPFALYVGVKGDPNFIQCCHGGIEPGYDTKEFLDSSANYASLQKTFENYGFFGQPIWDQLFVNGAKVDKKEAPQKRDWFLGNLNFNPVQSTPYESLLSKNYNLKNNYFSGFLWSDFYANENFSFNEHRGHGFVAGQEATNGIGTVCNIFAYLRAHQHSRGIKIGAINQVNDIISRWNTILKWQTDVALAQPPVEPEAPSPLSPAAAAFKQLPFTITLTIPPKFTVPNAQTALDNARWKEFKQKLPSFPLSSFNPNLPIITFTTASEGNIDNVYDSFGILTIAPKIQDSRMAIYEAEVTAKGKKAVSPAEERSRQSIPAVLMTIGEVKAPQAPAEARANPPSKEEIKTSLEEMFLFEKEEFILRYKFLEENCKTLHKDPYQLFSAEIDFLKEHCAGQLSEEQWEKIDRFRRHLERVRDDELPAPKEDEKATLKDFDKQLTAAKEILAKKNPHPSIPAGPAAEPSQAEISKIESDIRKEIASLATIPTTKDIGSLLEKIIFFPATWDRCQLLLEQLEKKYIALSKGILPFDAQIKLLSAEKEFLHMHWGKSSSPQKVDNFYSYLTTRTESLHPENQAQEQNKNDLVEKLSNISLMARG